MRGRWAQSVRPRGPGSLLVSGGLYSTRNFQIRRGGTCKKLNSLRGRGVQSARPQCQGIPLRERDWFASTHTGGSENAENELTAERKGNPVWMAVGPITRTRKGDKKKISNREDNEKKPSGWPLGLLFRWKAANSRRSFYFVQSDQSRQPVHSEESDD